MIKKCMDTFQQTRQKAFSFFFLSFSVATFLVAGVDSLQAQSKPYQAHKQHKKLFKRDELANSTWQLTLFAVPFPDIIFYGNVHFDGTGGYTGSETAVSGQTGIPLPGWPVQSTLWSGQYKKICERTFKLFHTHIILNNPTSTPGVLLPFKRVKVTATLTLSKDCKTFSIDALAQLFELDDPTLTGPSLDLELKFTGNRICF